MARRYLTKDNLSLAHIKWYSENNFEVLDANYNSLDLNSSEYTRAIAQKVYSISVLSSVNGVVIDSGNSNSLSSSPITLPIMYNKTYRDANDWVTVPLVGGRKAIYVAADGTDGDDGLTPTTPKLTVSAAFNILSAGDHVYFKRGGVWNNQAFGGTADGLPTNLCLSSASYQNKSGSSITCPTFVAAYGDASAPLPLFNITNSAITTFFFADNDDQFSGLKNFYVKCLHVSGGARDVRDEGEGDLFPAFFTLLNTGGSAVAQGVSGDAMTDNILIEGCKLEEIGNAISLQSYYNSLVAGANGKYQWGTQNYVSSYNTPAAITNVLIRRNIFKDLYFVPAGSITRDSSFTQNVFANASYRGGEAGSLFRYNNRVQALLSQGRQPKAIYMYGTSGQANILDGNIFYRCGNKLETYPDTFDKFNATVLTEGGFGGVHIFRNLFYKCSNIAAMQLDGGANISNIYYRNPESIRMLADVGLFSKKTYQGVPIAETSASVSAGVAISALEGNFVPYWYWFNKNNALSIVARNIIEEPQDVGYNSKNVSGDQVVLRRGAIEQTAEAKSTAIKILGGTVDVYNNYIGNISKGISTGLEAVNLKGFGSTAAHWNRGTSSITVPQTSVHFRDQNKVTFRDNVINNHGTIFLHTHNYPNNYFDPTQPRSTDNLFNASALTIRNNTIRNNSWNKNASYAGSASLQDFGVGPITVYSDTTYSDANKIVFTGNKIGFNAGPDVNRGFNIFGRAFEPFNGQYIVNAASGIIQGLFGTTASERLAVINSNPIFAPRNLQSVLGDTNISFLESYAANSVSDDDAPTEWGTGKLENGWHKFEPYNYGQPNGTRIFYVDPNSNVPNPTGQHPSSPFRDLKSAIQQIQIGRPDWILLKRGTVFNFDEGPNGANVSAGPTRRHTTFIGEADYGNMIDGLKGLSKQYPFIFGAYGSDADPATGNWFGNSTEARPLLTRRLDGPVSGVAGQPGVANGVGGFFWFRGPQSVSVTSSEWFSRYVVMLDLHMSGVNWTTPTSQNGFCRLPQHELNRSMIEMGNWQGQLSSYLFEGLLLENWNGDLWNILDSGTMPFDPVYPEPRNGRYFDQHASRDITMRRSGMYKAFSAESMISQGRASLAYHTSCKQIKVIESVLDGGGCNPDIRRVGGLNQNGQGSIYSHNLYYSGNTREMELVRSINARSSSHGVQFRGGGKLIENLFIKNPIQALVDSCESGDLYNGTVCQQMSYFGRKNSLISGNVFTDATIIGGIGPFYGDRGWGFQSINGSGCTVKDNIFTRVSHDPQDVFNNPTSRNPAFAMTFTARVNLGNPPVAACLTTSALSIIDNIIYKWQVPNGDGTAIELLNADLLSNFTMTGNKITFNPVVSTGQKTVAIRVENGPSPTTLSSWKVGSNNYGTGFMTWCSQSIPALSGCLTCAGGLNPNSLNFNSLASFVIPRYWGDNTSIFAGEEYPNPEVTIVDYVNKVATEVIPANVDKLDYFLTKARNNRKGAWDKRWTALEAVNFFRKNFGKVSLGRVSSVDHFMLSAIENLACNNSSMNSFLIPQNIVTQNLQSLLTVTAVGTGTFTPDLPVVNTNLIDNLEGATVMQDDTDSTLTIRNPLSQAIPTYIYESEGSDVIVGATIQPRKSLVINKSQVTESLQDVVKRYKLPVMVDTYGQIEKTEGSIPAAKIVTVEDARVDILSITEQLQLILNTYNIQTPLPTLIYGESKESFYTEGKELVQSQKKDAVTYYINAAFPIILNRRNTLLVVADFMRYAASVIDKEYRTLLYGSDYSGDLLQKYAKRLELLRSDIANYCDAALVNKKKSVDQVYTELGISATEPSEQDINNAQDGDFFPEV